jgi:hypothetical protein
MSISVTWDGTTYSIPQSGEINWASLTNFLVALGQKAAIADEMKQAIRVATVNPVVVSDISDFAVVTILDAFEPVTVNLPAGSAGRIYAIVDGKGNASIDNITINPSTGDTIAGAENLVLNKNRQVVWLQYFATGTDWKIINYMIPPGQVVDADISGVISTAGKVSGDAITSGTISGSTAFNTSGALTVSGAAALNGSVTLGDQSSDALTINSLAVSIPNGLNFDSNTLVIDAASNRVGVGIASPTVALDVVGSAKVSTAFTVNGNTQFGDASTDVMTIQGTAITIPNGLNFDSNTLVLDAANNRVGVGIASPTSTMHVFGNMTITNTGASDCFVVEDSASPDTSPFVIDTNGRVLKNRSVSTSWLGIGGSADVQIHSGFPISLSTWSTSTFSANKILFTKSNNNTVGTGGLVTVNTVLGVLEFAGSFEDGVGYGRAAQITSAVDYVDSVYAAIGGRIVFNTITSFVGGPPLESMRIDSSGRVGIGTTPSELLHVNGDLRIDGDATLNGTGFLKVTAGSTVERPGSPLNGMIRYNTDSKNFEGRADNTWVSFGGPVALSVLPSDTGTQNISQYLDQIVNLHVKNVNARQRVASYINGITAVNNAYIGGVYSPTQNRIYLVPWFQGDQPNWHYIDCATGNVVAYAHGVTARPYAYFGGVYSPTQNRIYLVPDLQSFEANWHYIDCATGNVVAYASGISIFGNGYLGGVYSPTQNRIYLVPFGQSSQANWHYIDCATGNVVAYAHGITAVGYAYMTGAYSPTQNRIYLGPWFQGDQPNWHYIDCATGNVVAYAHGVTALNGAYRGGVYSPTQNRIYFVPAAQADQTNWHYIDCATGSVVAYAHGVTAQPFAYFGGVYSPTQNRIYFVPAPQADQPNWHYIDCATGNVVAYAHGVTAVNGAYAGGVYSPTENRIYFVPNEQSDETKWHFVSSTSEAELAPALFGSTLLSSTL